MNNQSLPTPPEPNQDIEEDVRPSNLPMQTVRPDVFVPIATDTQAKKRRVVSLTSKIVIFISIIIGVIAWNIWVVQPYFVDGESMVPTLNTKDILLVQKFPQTWASMTNSKYIPGRYDVVIVQNPQRPEEKFVKRVIGLPGERVVLKDGVMKIYSQTVPRGEDVTLPPCCTDLQPTSGRVDTVVREGHIFVVGDNRTPGGSIDSRSSLGQIPSRNIIGKAFVRVSPVSQIRGL